MVMIFRLCLFFVFYFSYFSLRGQVCAHVRWEDRGFDIGFRAESDNSCCRCGQFIMPDGRRYWANCGGWLYVPKDSCYVTNRFRYLEGCNTLRYVDFYVNNLPICGSSFNCDTLFIRDTVERTVRVVDTIGLSCESYRKGVVMSTSGSLNRPFRWYRMFHRNSGSVLVDSVNCCYPTYDVDGLDFSDGLRFVNYGSALGCASVNGIRRVYYSSDQSSLPFVGDYIEFGFNFSAYIDIDTLKINSLLRCVGDSSVFVELARFKLYSYNRELNKRTYIGTSYFMYKGGDLYFYSSNRSGDVLDYRYISGDLFRPYFRNILRFGRYWRVDFHSLGQDMGYPYYLGRMDPLPGNILNVKPDCFLRIGPVVEQFDSLSGGGRVGISGVCSGRNSYVYVHNEYYFEYSSLFSGGGDFEYRRVFDYWGFGR